MSTTQAKRGRSGLDQALGSIPEATSPPAKPKPRTRPKAKPKAKGQATGGYKGGETAGGLRRAVVYLAPELEEALRSRCQRIGLTQSAALKLALEAWLEDGR